MKILKPRKVLKHNHWPFSNESEGNDGLTKPFKDSENPGNPNPDSFGSEADVSNIQLLYSLSTLMAGTRHHHARAVAR